MRTFKNHQSHVPPHPKVRLARLDALGAPSFTELPCPSCGAEASEVCAGRAEGQPAHFARAQAALTIAYRPEEAR